MEKMTYESINKVIHEYFGGFVNTINKSYEENEKHFAKFFTRTNMCRCCDMPLSYEQPEWVYELANARPTHYYMINIDPPYGYVVIDVENAVANVVMKEDIFDTETERYVRSIHNSATLKFAIEDGEVKIDRELISRFPGYFQTDFLNEHPRNNPGWLEMDYTEELSTLKNK